MKDEKQQAGQESACKCDKMKKIAILIIGLILVALAAKILLPKLKAASN